MENSDWKRKTAKRFVAFFDIMGFKEMVERNSHKEVVGKLETLKNALNQIEAITTDKKLKNEYSFSESRSITFSDSIVIFTKGESAKDACKIIADSAFLLHIALKNRIAIKGALSYGEITVDFENSLFFGRPIIDSYLLHDQLKMYAAILDNNIEAKLTKLEIPEFHLGYITNYKANLKSGKIIHKLISSRSKNLLSNKIENLEKLYNSVCGEPRVYIDNTLEYLNSLEVPDK